MDVLRGGLGGFVVDYALRVVQGCLEDKNSFVRL